MMSEAGGFGFSRKVKTEPPRPKEPSTHELSRPREVGDVTRAHVWHSGSIELPLHPLLFCVLAMRWRWTIRIADTHRHGQPDDQRHGGRDLVDREPNRHALGEGDPRVDGIDRGEAG